MRLSFLLLLALLGSLPARADLTADNLLLVVNKNVPAGREVAEFYAQQRHVPADRIVEVDVPAVDEISPNEFDEAVVPVIQRFIRDHKLEDKITCLITFYGMPLRIKDRKLSGQENFEYSLIKDQLGKSTGRMRELAGKLEALAAEVDGSFVAKKDSDVVESIISRIEHAGNWTVDHLREMPDAARKKQFNDRLDAITNEFRLPMPAPTTAPVPAITSTQVSPAYRDALHDRRFDPAARAEIREIARQTLDLASYSRILETQLGYLEPKDSESALDNELALLWWSFYNRKNWQPNLLCFRNANLPGPRTMMVMRLDGFQPERVKTLIRTGIEVEQSGLSGRVVIDARGAPMKQVEGKYDAVGYYDQSLRDLAALITAHSRLEVLLDDKPELLPPGAADNVAVYCGWYSLRKYVPCCKFAPGAVGFHIASFEMLQLHDSNEPGWVTQLLLNGVVSTMGPVAEPYLHAFPLPQDFFGLLLTGKLTIAETYWRSCPLTSWKLAVIGDPLYKPFAVNPPLRIEDLPAPLQRVFSDSGK